MEYVSVTELPYDLFRELLTEYYRDGEDADTPQEQMDEFIRYLHGMCVEGTIHGVVDMGEKPAGFVLWGMDRADWPFSNWPGLGTILEIGLRKEFRGSARGSALVRFAESQMEAKGYYVCAYGPAEAFWKKCGYTDSGKLAENGLKLMIKGDCGGR